METEEPGAVDLLGDPLRPIPDKRGRRKLRFHPQVYEKVEVLAAAGNLSQEEIADAVGISDKTLRKYFRKELANALARQQAEYLDMLATAARKGNVSAIKAYGAEIEKRRAAAALKERERPTRTEPERKGVKAARQEAAASVVAGGGKYAPAAPPKLN